MEFISVREFRANTAKLWRKLRKEKRLVVTRRGKPVAIVTATSEKEIGEALLRDEGQRALAALDRAQAAARARGVSGMSMAQIDTEIAATRRDRRQKKQ
jgi:prevent-host-death family protein